MILCDVTCYYHIQRKTEGGTVERGNRKNAPHAKRLENRPEKSGVARKNVFESVQERAITRLPETTYSSPIGAPYLMAKSSGKKFESRLTVYPEFNIHWSKS